MTQDKQLRAVALDAVVEKRRLGQALNAKEFAVLAGISYSVAREWFRAPWFPVFRNHVFWEDFTEWRRGQLRLNRGEVGAGGTSVCERQVRLRAEELPAKAARILLER